jgi:CheY-like chemotaxis protein/signal transduction histidine kinase
LLLKQTKILDSERNDLDFDRFSGLARRVIQTEYAFISFIDFERQWIKSNIGITITNPNIDRRDSIDAQAMFTTEPEVVFIPDLTTDPKYKSYTNPIGLEDTSIVFRFYLGAVIIVDGFRVGVLSVLDTQPREHVSIESRQNLADLAAAVSNLVKERRSRNMRFKKERANLMLGLNHNLRTPLMSLTLVTEMLRGEVKQMAMTKHNNTTSNSGGSPSCSMQSLALSQDYNNNGNAGSVMLPIDRLTSSIDEDREFVPPVSLPRLPVAAGQDMNCNSVSVQQQCSMDEQLLLRRHHSRSTSRQHTPDIPCMNLLGDLQTSLQQLGLLVEMGLVLGKITSGMSILADGSYDSIRCDVLKIYEKVQSLTQQIGRSQNVLWNINKMYLDDLRAKQFSHPDVLMFVLISTLTQVLPHADMIKVKGNFLPVEELSQIIVSDTDEDIVRMTAAIVELTAPTVVIGRVGLLITELEIFGDPRNLQEIVSKLNTSVTDNSSNEGSSQRSSDLSDDGCAVGGSYSNSKNHAMKNSRPKNNVDQYINVEVEEFGGSLFALGELLENVMGGSSFVMTDHGCVFSFTIPCRVEMDPVITIPFTDSDMDSVSIASDSTASDIVVVRKGLQLDDKRISFAPDVDTKVFDQHASSSSSSYSDVKPIMKNNTKGSPDKLQRKSHRSRAAAAPDNFVVYTKEAILLEPLTPNANNSSGPVKIVTLANLAEAVKESKKTSPCTAIDRPTTSLSLREMIGLEVPTYKRILKVLLVDDSVTVQKVVGIWLKKKNCLVTSALNGLIALELMKTTVFDIVFMDFLMPVMDGLSCMRHIQNYQRMHPMLQKGVEDQWVIGLSATALPKDEEDAFDAGMHMFCAKPVEMIALTHILEAKRIGLNYITLAQLVKDNRACTMTAQQQDEAAELLLPRNAESMSKDAMKEREAMKVNITANVNTNIFGGFHFSVCA